MDPGNQESPGSAAFGRGPHARYRPVPVARVAPETRDFTRLATAGAMCADVCKALHAMAALLALAVVGRHLPPRRRRGTEPLWPARARSRRQVVAMRCPSRRPNIVHIRVASPSRLPPAAKSSPEVLVGIEEVTSAERLGNRKPLRVDVPPTDDNDGARLSVRGELPMTTNGEV